MNNEKKYIEETKTWLINFRSIKAHLNNLREDLKIAEIEARKKEDVDCDTGLSYDGIPTSKSYNISRMIENEAIRQADKIFLIKERIKQTEYIINKIERSVDALPYPEDKVIRLKYMNDESLSWKQIADSLGYCPDHVSGKLRNRAVEKIKIAIFGIE